MKWKYFIVFFLQGPFFFNSIAMGQAGPAESPFYEGKFVKCLLTEGRGPCKKNCQQCRMNARQRAIELSELEWAIGHMEDQLLYYRAQALNNLDWGMRLQFQKGQFSESLKAFKESEYEWQQVDLLQKKIAYLKRRQEFLRNCRL